MHLWGSPLILLLCASRRNQALGDVCNLLVDEELADQVWEAWDKGEIDDQIAWLAWWLIALSDRQSNNFLLRLGCNNENNTMRRATP